MDERKLTKAKQAGNNATRLLTELEPYITEIENSYVDQWKSSSDKDEREYLHTKLSVLHDLINQFEVVIKNGRYAEEQLNRRY